MSNENCNENTFWSKTENGIIEVNKSHDKLYVEIGIWRKEKPAYNDYAILNKETAIKLRDFLNEFIEANNEK